MKQVYVRSRNRRRRKQPPKQPLTIYKPGGTKPKPNTQDTRKTETNKRKENPSKKRNLDPLNGSLVATPIMV